MFFFCNFEFALHILYGVYILVIGFNVGLNVRAGTCFFFLGYCFRRSAFISLNIASLSDVFKDEFEPNFWLSALNPALMFSTRFVVVCMASSLPKQGSLFMEM